jgi:hypothetical protein
MYKCWLDGDEDKTEVPAYNYTSLSDIAETFANEYEMPESDNGFWVYVEDSEGYVSKYLLEKVTMYKVYKSCRAKAG